MAPLVGRGSDSHCYAFFFYILAKVSLINPVRKLEHMEENTGGREHIPAELKRLLVGDAGSSNRADRKRASVMESTYL